MFRLDGVSYTPPDAAPDAPRYPGQIINDPSSDYDGDGLPNATDPCVLIAATEPGGREDRDGDGVGDLCDPHPDVAGDCLVLFDSFATPPLSPHWKYDGEEITRDQTGYLSIPGGGQTLVYLDQPLELASLYVIGYIHYGANGPGDRFAIQVFTDVSRSPAATGLACGVESDKASSQVTIADVTNGADMLAASMPLGNVLVTAGVGAGLAWTADGCRGVLDPTGSGSQVDATVPTEAPPGGVFGLRTLLAGFNVYVVAGYGRGCGM